MPKAIKHGPESGRAREEIIRRFLRRLLPSGYGIDTGFVIDSQGDVSKQIDIVIYRTGYHPVFEIAGVKYFIIESVAAVIENKASVTSREVLRTTFENLASVKLLDHTGGGRNYVVLGGDKGPYVADHRDHSNLNVFGAIVTDDSVSSDTYLDELGLFIANRERALWPNMYVAVRDFAGIFLKESTEGLAVTTVYADMRYAAVTVPTAPRCSSPSRLAQRLVNALRTFSLIDFQPVAYFPGSCTHTGRRDVPPPPNLK